MIIIKNKLIFTLKTAILTAMFSALLFSCAQVGTIGGGDDDTDAPILKKSKPKIYSGNFHKKKAKLKFDEYFTLEKIDQKFLMSPPHYEKAPKIKIRGKKIITKFKEPLRNDTTYTLQFFDCIQDFHEGNHEPDFDFVFSTGAVCDSFAISGTVRDAETLKKEENLLVGIYAENMLNEDSCFLKYKPTYITRTDSSGHFKVKNVSPGQYKIFVLGDINETQKFDIENEKIGFINTVVIPEAQTVTKIDSLSAGTVLHSGEPGHKIIDTLQNDTVIIQNILYTTPNNINLVAFNQIKTIQYISERSREIRPRFFLGFNKSIGNDSVIITYVDDTLKSPQMYYDFNYQRDSLYVWLLDTADVRNDTLQLRVTFPTIDSLQNPITETDTLNLRYSPKKQNSKDKNAQNKAPEKPNIDSLSFIVKTNFTGDFDLNGLASLEIPVPTTKIDTSKIHLYQLRDTTFEDDMNQKLIKAARLDSANFRLVFKRGIKGDIIFYPTDTTVAENWYTATYSENRDTVNITITDTAMVKKGRFKNMLKHYNDYYLGEVQKLRDTVPTNIISQKRLKFERPSRDSIKIVFEKPLVRKTDISTINVSTTYDVWADTYPDNNKLTIIMRDTAAINKDTLAIKLSTFDRYVKSKNNKISERFFRDTIFAIYEIKTQKIKSVKRIANDTLQFVFKYPLKDRPFLKLVDTVYNNNWYNIQLSEKQDTMTVLLNSFAANIDTLNYSISYQSLDRFDHYFTQTDTMVTFKPKEANTQTNQNNQSRRRSNVGLEKQKEKEEAAKNQVSATLRIPVKYELIADTLHLRDKLIKYKWEPAKKYELVVDDSVFTSILNTPNLYISSEGTIRTEDYYGSMTINLLNTGNIEHYPDIDDDLPPFDDVDTARVRIRKRTPLVTDSTANYTALSSGMLVVCLCNNKDEIVYSKTATCDGKVVFDFIVPGEYTLKIIHDRNSNKKWDTGDYLKHIYPERVIAYPRKQNVKSKWNVDVLWKL